MGEACVWNIRMTGPLLTDKRLLLSFVAIIAVIGIRYFWLKRRQSIVCTLVIYHTPFPRSDALHRSSLL